MVAAIAVTLEYGKPAGKIDGCCRSVFLDSPPPFLAAFAGQHVFAGSVVIESQIDRASALLWNAVDSSPIAHQVETFAFVELLGTKGGGVEAIDELVQFFPAR